MTLFTRSIVSLIFLFAVACMGCGGRMQPVQGKLVYGDLSPATDLVGGTVEFDSLDEALSARGEIDANGEFQLTTLSNNDGVPVGKYRVLITMPGPTGDEAVKPILDPMYSSYDTSPLMVEIVPGRNEPSLTVRHYTPAKGS